MKRLKQTAASALEQPARGERAAGGLWRGQDHSAEAGRPLQEVQRGAGGPGVAGALPCSHRPREPRLLSFPQCLPSGRFHQQFHINEFSSPLVEKVFLFPNSAFLHCHFSGPSRMQQPHYCVHVYLCRTCQGRRSTCST